MSNVSVKEQKQVTDNLPSLTKQWHEILPNPGKLETVLSDSAVQNLGVVQNRVTLLNGIYFMNKNNNSKSQQIYLIFENNC